MRAETGLAVPGLALFCWLIAIGGSSASAVRLESVAADEASREAIRAEIAALDERIRELLARLPPEERDEVRRALARGRAAPVTVIDDSSVAGSSVPEPPADAPPAQPGGTRAEVEDPDVVPGGPEAEVPEAEIPEAEVSAIEPPEIEVPESGGDGDLEDSAVGDAAVGDAAVTDRAIAAETECRPLDALDSNDDGRISAGDRYWRHLYVARSGTQALTREGVQSLYEAGARELDLSRRSFTNRKREVEDLDVSQRVSLTFRGRAGFESVPLVADASGLEGAGLRLLGAAGEPLAGLHVLEAQMAFETSDGARPVFCDPES